MMPASMVLSCEHAGNKIPRRFQKLYLGQKAILKSHRGFDIGALGVTKILAKALHLPFYKSEISRLLIDHNRSLTNKALYSEFSASLKQTEKTFILNNYYRPHHLKVQNNVQRILARKKSVIHFAIHSFTPKLNGVIRNADIGILFDPKSKFESEIAQKLKTHLRQLAPELVIRLNYPYKGSSDGLTKILRKNFGTKNYAGIEIELNQKYFKKRNHSEQKFFGKLLAESLLNLKETHS